MAHSHSTLNNSALGRLQPGSPAQSRSGSDTRYKIQIHKWSNNAEILKLECRLKSCYARLFHYSSYLDPGFPGHVEAEAGARLTDWVCGCHGLSINQQTNGHNQIMTLDYNLFQNCASVDGCLHARRKWIIDSFLGPNKSFKRNYTYQIACSIYNLGTLLNIIEINKNDVLSIQFPCIV